MAEENVENLRAFWEAWNRGEADWSLLDPEVIYEDANLPDHVGEKYHGPEGVARASERWTEPYEEIAVELEEVFAAGDRVVSIHSVRTKARHSGIEQQGPVAYAWTFRDGKVIHFQSYTEPAEAFEAAGITRE